MQWTDWKVIKGQTLKASVSDESSTMKQGWWAGIRISWTEVDRRVYIKDGDDTDGTLGSFGAQTTNQVPTGRKQEEEKGVSGRRSETRDEIVNVAQSVRLEEVMRGEQPNESAVSCSVSSTCLVSQDKNLFNCHTEAGFHHVCTVGHNQ